MLTAGAPELDVLLMVHLQVCKALLQVAEGVVGGWGRGALAGRLDWELGVLFAKSWS